MTGLPPLMWLKTFESAARTLSFAAAAAELNMSTGAISYQIRALEAHLGFSLFARMPRGVKLTALGMAYMPAVRKAFDELADSTTGLFGGPERVKVTLHAPASLAALWLARQLPTFMTANPRIDIRMSSLVWDNPAPDETTDLEIRYGSGHWANYRSELLVHQDLIVVCSPALLERAHKTSDVVNFIQRHQVCIIGYEKHRLSMRRELQTPDRPTEYIPAVDTTIAALELAASDGGCVLTHRLLAESYLRSGRLVAALDRKFPDENSYFLCAPLRRERSSRQTELFREWLIEISTLERICEGPGRPEKFGHP